MKVRADYDPKYFRRFLLIGLGCIAFTCWCFYDALVKYPSELERAKVYWKPSQEPGEKYKAMERTDWREVVKKNSWPTAAPRKPSKIEHGIDQQYLFAAICGLIALPCLWKWFSARGSWVEGTDSGLTSSWNRSVQYDKIVSIDKTKWEKKGITKILYEDEGKQQTFVFDDFKFDRKVMSEILTRIESGLKNDQIIGGDRETAIKARKEAEVEAKKLAENETAAEP